jgi:hypothetical protein
MIMPTRTIFRASFLAALAAVAAPACSALPTLIDGWMALPQWREKMLGFFQQAFQQTQTEPG